MAAFAARWHVCVSRGCRVKPADRETKKGAGALVADYLLSEKKVVSIPGHVYGPTSADCIRLILCSSDDVFGKGVKALEELPPI